MHMQPGYRFYLVPVDLGPGDRQPERREWVLMNVNFAVSTTRVLSGTM